MADGPRIYGDLADWYPLLTDPVDYVEEAAWYAERLREAAKGPLREVLELGSGAGANALHLKAHFALTLVDRSADMLRQSRRLHPDLQHHQGDMRTFRLGRTFDAVFVHDAACYLLSADDVHQAVATAAAHLASGGVALFCPDDLAETWTPEVDCGGHDGADGRAMRYLEWSWAPDEGETAITDFAFLLRAADGTVRVVHDRHVTGRLPRQTWLDAFAAAGFDARTVPLEHSEVPPGRHEVFVAVKR